MFPLGLWSNLLRFFDAADTEAENKKEQQIAIRIAEIENTFNFFIGMNDSRVVFPTEFFSDSRK